MNRHVPCPGILLLTLLTAPPGQAQISMQPTPPPAVTAESEEWYLSGGPLSFGGNVYHPAGPVTHFNRNEMVRSGLYGRVPVYVRTTQEPGSIIYVPLAGGLMRPYERRRAGELAGTVGSSAPSFPVVLPAAEPADAGGPLRAAAPPTGAAVATVGRPEARPEPAAPAARPAPGVAGTAGAVTLLPAAPVPTRVQTVRRPVGLNEVFIDFANTRWFAAGPAVVFRPDAFRRIGEHRGFPVYAEPARREIIYLPPVAGPPLMVTPYQRR